MKTLTIILLLTVLTLSTGFELEQQNFADVLSKIGQNRALTRDKKCKQTGLMCKSCEELVFCAVDQSGEWTQRPVQTCPAETACRGTSCISEENVPECSSLSKVEFPCSTVGVFPNPGDCKKYHMCYPDGAAVKHAVVDCENSDHYGYNPKTTFCDKKLPTNGYCTGFQVPKCEKLGDNGPVPLNPTLYYMCLPEPIITIISSRANNYEDEEIKLYPFQLACENGKVYTKNSGCK